MGLRDDLYAKLKAAAENPADEFDRIIQKNSDILEHMNEAELSDIYSLRRKGSRLCRQIPYSRDEIKELVASGEVSSKGAVAELIDCFNAADYVFGKASSENF